VFIKLVQKCHYDAEISNMEIGARYSEKTQALLQKKRSDD